MRYPQALRVSLVEVVVLLCISMLMLPEAWLLWLSQRFNPQVGTVTHIVAATFGLLHLTMSDQWQTTTSRKVAMGLFGLVIALSVLRMFSFAQVQVWVLLMQFGSLVLAYVFRFMPVKKGPI